MANFETAQRQRVLVKLPNDSAGRERYVSARFEILKIDDDTFINTVGWNDEDVETDRNDAILVADILSDGFGYLSPETVIVSEGELGGGGEGGWKEVQQLGWI